MKIAVLTSSRADYGIYLPLLKRMQADKSIALSVIAFGSHCNLNYGKTIEQIKKDGFDIEIEIDNFLEGDEPQDIANSFSNTIRLFTEFWGQNTNKFEWVLSLGDRFEMAAAVISSIPFQIQIAHFYAGEKTLGAIDNIYRDQISLAAKAHFVSIPAYAKRTQELLGYSGTTKVIGVLSLLNIQQLSLLDINSFYEKWEIDLSNPTVLVTVHPETIKYWKNELYANETAEALRVLSDEYQIVITMPNADTMNSVFRESFQTLKKEFPNRIFLIENFGTESYFSCMKHSSLLIGNTSSGIVEAASFGKFVINLGERQKGRYMPENVKTVRFEKETILNAVKEINGRKFEGINPYFVEDPTDRIIKLLKELKTDEQ